ncbi:MAG TPA: YezD family protein [Tepidiformaceae bacterium]|nr:YezD family protein [Tepidiformaceae bacterium]
MNSSNDSRAVPRWVRELTAESVPSDADWTVLREVLAAIRRVTHGSVSILVQDSRVVQIDTTEKRRL